MIFASIFLCRFIQIFFMTNISSKSISYLFKYIFGICIIMIFTTACRKDTDFISTGVGLPKTPTIYKSYVDSIRMSDSSTGHLYNTLLWNNLTIMPLDSGKSLIYIPSSLRTKGNVMNGLILIQDIETRAILQSYYTQLENLNISSALNASYFRQNEVDESAKIIANYFTRAKNNFNGSIQFFSVENIYLFTIGFENGNPTYFKAIGKAKEGSKEGGVQAFSDCVDYYLTTFYDDGSSETEFLYQSCARDCLQTRIINTNGEMVTSMSCGDNIDRTGGGGGDGGVEILNMSVAQTVSLIFISKNKNDYALNKIV